MRTQSSPSLSRRGFLRAAAIALPGLAVTRIHAQTAAASESHDADPDRRLLKSLKINMVQSPGSLTDKFKMLREIGFDGIELDSPGVDVEETKRAIDASGLAVDGTVCSSHWQIRHTDPDAAVRKQALDDLLTAIRQTHAVSGHSVLLVPGHGRDGKEADTIPRAVENIAKAIPLAARLGVIIAIENVWNHFLYDHNGPADQTADRLRDFIDAFQSPWVGVQFDIGNHRKYGDPASWIRTLGKRIVKLDVKDWSVSTGWTPIGEGDVNWTDVRAALTDIGYAGWAAAEVKGGDREALETVSRQMDSVFAL